MLAFLWPELTHDLGYPICIALTRSRPALSPGSNRIGHESVIRNVLAFFAQRLQTGEAMIRRQLIQGEVTVVSINKLMNYRILAITINETESELEGIGV